LAGFCAWSGPVIAKMACRAAFRRGRFRRIAKTCLTKSRFGTEAGASVEQVVAVTANASGRAAYYAATREYPDRHITLRHKSSVVARWSGPKH